MNKKQKMKAALDSLFTPAARPEAAGENGNGQPRQPEAAAVAAPAAAPAHVEPAPAPVPVPAAVEPVVVPVRAPAPVSQADGTAGMPTKPNNPQPAPAQAGQGGAQALSGVEKQLVVFHLGEEYYGIGIEAVESIIKMQTITRVPHTPGYVCGVTNLRGTVLPVVDLRTRFNLPKKAASRDSRIIVLKSSGSSAGVIVDGVSEVTSVPAESFEPAPTIAMTIESGYIQGLARCEDKLIILLDLDKILKIGQRNSK